MLNYRAPTLLDSHPLSFHGFQGLSRADKAQSCGKSGRALRGLTRAPLVGESGGQSSGTHPWGNKAAWRGSELELGGWHSSGTWRRRQWPVAHGLGGLRRLPGSPEALDSAGEGRHQPTSNVVSPSLRPSHLKLQAHILATWRITPASARGWPLLRSPHPP